MNISMTLKSLLIASALLLPSLSSVAFADRSWHGKGAPKWHGEIHHFHEYDEHIWHSGYWHNGSHAGRLGWWWIIGGFWYWYPRPIYPYPDPYTPPINITVQSVPVAPEVQVVQPQAPSVWYHCDNPTGYYPYVAECVSGWKTVPATIPPSQPAAQLPPPPVR